MPAYGCVGRQRSTRPCSICACGPVLKNGYRNGRIRYRCATCGQDPHRLSAGRPDITDTAVLTRFLEYVTGTSTQAHMTGTGLRTQRRDWQWCWSIPTPQVEPTGEVYSQVFIDGIYLPYGWCLLIARSQSHVVTWQWTTRETKAAYMALLDQIAPPCLVTTDGAGGALKALHDLWPDTPVQRCLVHVHRNNLRDLTHRPATPAGKALYGLSIRLLKVKTRQEAAAWSGLLVQLHTQYQAYFTERTWARDVPASQRREGRTWWYTHERDRRVYHRLARLQQEGSLFAFLDFDPPQERTTNPVESINSRIRALTYAHRGMTETHMQAMINWYLHSTTENPQSASHILREWNTAGRPQRRTIPKKKTKAKLKPTVGDMPVHYDTALTKEEGLWPRKGWAGRSH